MLQALQQGSDLTHDILSALSIKRLTLAHFRNYIDLALDLEASPFVVLGANGSGKTNLLEAVSLFVPGRGLRRAAAEDFQNNQASSGWAVAAHLSGAYGDVQLGTGQDRDSEKSDKRLVCIDGRYLKSQQELGSHVALAWVTPEMDRLLVEAPSVRRKWLDRLVFSFDPLHGGRVQRYEKALRERLLILREGGKDDAWLSALEDEMARTGVAIAAARNELIRQLSAAIDETLSAFPQALLSVKGSIEEALLVSPALLIEDRMRASLAEDRLTDARTGTSATGPHRSDLAVIHRGKNFPAALCSTGEQKALIIAIMLAYTRTLRDHRKLVPLLLLDDIVAHLDDNRRVALFEELTLLKAQAWLTGTDKDLFKEFLAHAQVGFVEEGQVTMS